MHMSKCDMAVYFLELFSGNGSVSKVASMLLQCPVVTVDINPRMKPTIVLDILEWSDETNRQIAEIVPKGAKPIIWASPLCTEYSIAKTVGVRNLDYADRLVAKIEDIAHELDALFVFVENPATGMLKDREVISFMRHRYRVDYCQYGGLMYKPTNIWTSAALDTFKPKVCPRTLACSVTVYNKVTNRIKHPIGLHSLSYKQLIKVPDQLVFDLLRACINYMKKVYPEISFDKVLHFSNTSKRVAAGLVSKAS